LGLVETSLVETGPVGESLVERRVVEVGLAPLVKLLDGTSQVRMAPLGKARVRMARVQLAQTVMIQEPCVLWERMARFAISPA
jgi:hypothetical protein